MGPDQKAGGAAGRKAALTAPADGDGFSSSWERVGAERLHLRQRNNSNATAPVVMLHGLACSHRHLVPTAYAVRRHPVFLPDLLGFGLSDKPAAALDVGEHAQVIGALLDHLAIPPVGLVGCSFGAQVAAELTVRRPDLVASLILVGPTTDPTAASVQGQLRRLLLDLVGEDPRQARILAADIRDAGVRRILATLRHAVRHPMTATLGAITVPTLLVRGSADRIAPDTWLAKAGALMPQAQRLTIDRAAHNAVTTAGLRLGAAVEAFLGTGTDRPPPRAARVAA
ncbi:pimeloyl-ACP methyl ester carboxylesterase [Asanoa ferruginea]|uniref:Pimeloyl-ACP methyl ester carboxylesterase n=1 Tax=Asanoa ferruginea TaxID=53367 RepID=A0A3D9ZY21_9ACTN|nr:alpha/beta fold hydrolase [Asanoa ferruginea]REG01044.1 pimeloyl-ACP methyl ester carboxylesterase [Asanoa ferruginea]GIF53675.1 3-oxoadipate enol-lactonase [Asanoa ferruginea]